MARTARSETIAIEQLKISAGNATGNATQYPTEISMLSIVPAQTMRAQLPADWTIDSAEPRLSEQVSDVRAAATAALQAPLSSLALSELTSPESRVVIVVDAMPFALAQDLLSPVLDEIEGVGTPADRISVLTANQAFSTALATQFAGAAQFVFNDTAELSEFDDLGNVRGVPLQLNYRVAEADVLIVVHAVTTDAFAIYTNTGTALVRTAAGAATQNELRDARFLAENVTLHGYMRDLPFQRILADVAQRAGLKFALGVVLDEHDHVLDVQAGEPTLLNETLLPMAQTVREAFVPHDDYDIMFVDSASKPMTTFEASAVVARLGNMPGSPLMFGGVMVMEVVADEITDEVADTVADDRETASAAAAIQNFNDVMGMASEAGEVLKFLDRHVLKPGEEQAYLFSKAQEHYRVILVGEQSEDLARLCHCLSARDLRDGAELAESLVGHRPRAVIVSRPSFIVPLMGGLAVGFHDEDALDDADGAYAGILGDNDRHPVDDLLEDVLIDAAGNITTPAGPPTQTDEHDAADWIDDVERLLNTDDS